MNDPAYKLLTPPAIVETEAHPEVAPAEAEIDGPDPVPLAGLRQDDPFYYGWRPSREKTADGEEKLRWIPLTYEDLLDPPPLLLEVLKVPPEPALSSGPLRPCSQIRDAARLAMAVRQQQQARFSQCLTVL